MPRYKTRTTRTFDYEVTLLKESTDYDELGNPIKVVIRKSILCDLESIGRNEFYDASVQGLKPEITFVIHPFEYENEKNVEFQGEKYKVLRVYGYGADELELTCERVVGNG